MLYGDENKDKETTINNGAATQRNPSVYIGRIPRVLNGCTVFAVGSADDHDGTADRAQITQEEIEIEDEAVSEALIDGYDEKTCNSVFRIVFRDDGA